MPEAQNLPMRLLKCQVQIVYHKQKLARYSVTKIISSHAPLNDKDTF